MMDFRDTPEEAAFRTQVRAWLEANAQPKQSDEERFDAGMNDEERVAAARVWQKKKAAAGYAAITWPKEAGGMGGTPMQQVIYSQEEAHFLVPRMIFENSLGQCLPTVATWAIPELKARHVPRGLAGDEIWCQL
ncbi:acyl-CoA dehydrogenase family protein, partial [Denitratisoma oestradiolicum]